MTKYKKFLRRKARKELIIKAIDQFYTAIGMIILVVFLIISIPFVVLMEWMSGE